MVPLQKLNIGKSDQKKLISEKNMVIMTIITNTYNNNNKMKIIAIIAITIIVIILLVVIIMLHATTAITGNNDVNKSHILIVCYPQLHLFELLKNIWIYQVI